MQLWQSNKSVYTAAGSATVRTDRNGRFRVEGPFPPRYEGRSPHIHIRVVARDFQPLLSRYEPAAGSKRGNLRFVLTPGDL